MNQTVVEQLGWWVLGGNLAAVAFVSLRATRGLTWQTYRQLGSAIIKTAIAAFLLAFLQGSLSAGVIGIALLEKWLPPLSVGSAGAAVVLATLLWIHGGAVFGRFLQVRRSLSGGFLALSPLFLFFVLECACNEGLPSIKLFYVLLNYLLLGLLTFVFVNLFPRGRMQRLAALYVLAFLAGCANGFVLKFKGQPILPADISGIGTAAAVAGQYTYRINDGMAAALVFSYGCICLALALGEGERRARCAERSEGRDIRNQLSAFAKAFEKDKKAALAVFRHLRRPLCALCAFLVLWGWFSNVDFAKKYWMYLDIWDPSATYTSYGTPLSFAAFLQKMQVKAPEGYSSAAADEILEAYALEDADAAENEETAGIMLASETREEQGQRYAEGDAASEKKQPTVIAIMNESFSDLSVLGPLAAAGENLHFLHSLQYDAGTIEYGWNYVSTRGGGTSTSEFEFLTGNSMSRLIGLNPYAEFDFSKIPSMTEAFAAAGYQTVAMHPENPDNWRRSTVYKKMGFDKFLSKEDFEGYETSAWERISDRGDYERLIREYEERKDEDEPLFLFNVTMQNHSSYDLAQIPEEQQVAVDEAYAQYADVRAYLSLIHAADDALSYLISYFRAVDEPIIICFFGDHQPALDESFQDALAASGRAETDTDLMVQEKYYAVPYFIWTNQTDLAEQCRQGAETTLSSTNYLGIRLKQYAGLAASDYDRYLLAQEKEIPVLNFLGYRTKEGEWYALEDESAYSEWLARGAIVQYNAMFDQKKNWAHYGDSQ